MLNKSEEKRNQIQMFCIEDLVPKDHMLRKIERLFGTAKEHHGFRYTQMVGKAKMEMKVGLTFACLNLKKLAKILDRRQGYTDFLRDLFDILLNSLYFNPKKTK